MNQPNKQSSRAEVKDPYDFTDITKNRKKSLPKAFLIIAAVLILSGGAYGFSYVSKKSATPATTKATTTHIVATTTPAVLGAEKLGQPKTTPVIVPIYTPTAATYNPTYVAPASTPSSYSTIPNPTTNYAPPSNGGYTPTCSRAQITAKYDAKISSTNNNYDGQVGQIQFQANQNGTLDSGMTQGQIDGINQQRSQDIALLQSQEQAGLASCGGI